MWTVVELAARSVFALLTWAVTDPLPEQLPSWTDYGLVGLLVAFIVWMVRELYARCARLEAELRESHRYNEDLAPLLLRNADTLDRVLREVLHDPPPPRRR